MNRLNLMQGMALGLGLATAASAQVVVNSNIATSQTWVNTNVYQLDGEIYVLPGATLTIQPGTLIRSTTTSSLTISVGAQIFADGTADQPIVWTSTADTGVERVASNEWGNLNVLGDGYISEDVSPTATPNTPAPNSANRAQMEALTDPVLSLYGGGNDNHDAGSISFNSLRYGGFTLAPNVELNGISIGGVGRNTDMHHIEVFSNGDDGIEIWGGTLNMKYVVMSNVGDDSLDVDQGWRGKIQFGLILQGWSNTGAQEAGFGDNAIEADGAENNSYQPVTTATLYNFTIVGLPPVNAGDGTAGDLGVAFRDNANLQIRNTIWLDMGDALIAQGNGGSGGYGGGQLTFAQRWTTPATFTSPLNAFAAPEISPAVAYQAQVASGNLIDFQDNLFFNNIRPLAYAELNARSVFTGGGGTTNANNAIVTASPITSLVRGPVVSPNGTNTSSRVQFIDPTPANDALFSVGFAPNDGFYTSARYVGAFPRGNNWLIGWTALSQYGLTTSARTHEHVAGFEKTGATGVPVHYTIGSLATGTPVTFACDNVGDLGGGFRFGVWVFNVATNPFPSIPVPVVNAPVYPEPFTATPGQVQDINATGTIAFTINMPPVPSGFVFHTQYLTADPSLPLPELAASNGQRHVTP